MEGLISEFEAQILNWPDVTTRFMFGSLAYLVRGKLFAFLSGEYLVITNLNESSCKALTETYEAFPFESKGHPVGGWMQVAVADEAQLAEIMEFVTKSYDKALMKAKSDK